MTTAHPSSTLALVERAHEALLEGYAAPSATARHRAARMAALRAAAAVVAARDRRGRLGRLGPVSPWDLLARLVPELAEWARHFALVMQAAPLTETGERPVSVREADDLLRDAQTFLARAELAVGLPVRVTPVPRLAPARSA